MRVYRGRVSFLPADEMKDYKPKDSSINIIKNDSTTKIMENCKYLPRMDDPVPNDWLTMEENFILFLIVNLPLISPDFLVTPHADFNDGNMHLIFIKEGIKKTQLLKFLTHPGDKDHLDNPLVEYVKIKAFRLEPIGLLKGRDYVNNGVLMVDGEQVPYGNIQGEIMPGFANILAKKD